jgi:hypothetical protein
MRYPSEGTMEGSFWTIQFKYAKPGTMVRTEPMPRGGEEWGYLSYDVMPGVVYQRAHEGWQRYGDKGFLTLYAARKALRVLRATAKKAEGQWENWKGWKFRLVLVKFCIEVEEA